MKKLKHRGWVIKQAGFHNEIMCYRVPHLGGKLYVSVGAAMQAIETYQDTKGAVRL
jgi:hypothetical protein